MEKKRSEPQPHHRPSPQWVILVRARVRLSGGAVFYAGSHPGHETLAAWEQECQTEGPYSLLISTQTTAAAAGARGKRVHGVYAATFRTQ